MKKLKERLLHNCIMNPKKFWTQLVMFSITALFLTLSIGFTVGKVSYSEEAEIKSYADLYSKLEDEIKLVNYVKDTTTDNLKVQKLEAIADINIPDTVDVQHLDLMVVTAAYYDIPLRIFLRTAYKESRFHPTIVNHKQAKGYFQIRPITYNTYHKRIYINNLDPESNIRLAGYIFKDLKNRYKSWDLVLAAYNAGPANVDKYKGIPNYTETKDYIKFILK